MIIETLPTEWKQIKLKDIGNSIIGLTYKPSDVVQTGGKLVFRSSNIQDHKIDYSDQIRVITQIPNYLITREGDILICARNGSRKLIGKSAYITSKDANNTFGAFMSIFRTKNSRYIFHLFQSHLFQKEINKDLGPTINQVTTGNLLSYKFYLPPLPEQKRIVAVLETWDLAIEKLEKKINLKKEENKGLVQTLLSGRLRMKNFRSKWNVKRAGEIFKNVSKKNYPFEELLSATQQEGIIPRNNLSIRVTMPSGSTANYKLVEPGNFVISLRSFQGGIEYSRFRGIVSPAYTVLTNKVKIDHDFYRFYFKSYDFIEHLNIAVFGIRDGKQISYDDFCFINIPYPVYGEQKEIGSILKASEDEIKLLEGKRNLYKKQKKYLLSKLVTGEIRTPEDLTIFSNTDEKET